MKAEKSDNIKKNYQEISVKELLAMSAVQEAIKKYVAVPEKILIKGARSPYQNPDTKLVTQKIEGMSGTSIMDATAVGFTLVGMELDSQNAINKMYRIVDYTVGLEANMAGGKFGGYAAKGLKLLVTKMEEVRNGENENA